MNRSLREQIIAVSARISMLREEAKAKEADLRKAEAELDALFSTSGEAPPSALQSAASDDARSLYETVLALINSTPGAQFAAEELLAEAEARLGRPARREPRRGRLEREVVAAAEGMDLLVLARDGDRAHLGPRSLGPAARFVVDHAPCRVLLIWPDVTPAVTTIPPPPDSQPPRR